MKNNPLVQVYENKVHQYPVSITGFRGAMKNAGQICEVTRRASGALFIFPDNLNSFISCIEEVLDES